MTEYAALIYKTNRNKSYIASCMFKNIVGFGKTEEDAINNLKESLKSFGEKVEISIKPIYGFLMAK